MTACNSFFGGPWRTLTTPQQITRPFKFDRPRMWQPYKVPGQKEAGFHKRFCSNLKTQDTICACHELERKNSSLIGLLFAFIASQERLNGSVHQVSQGLKKGWITEKQSHSNDLRGFLSLFLSLRKPVAEMWSVCDPALSLQNTVEIKFVKAVGLRNISSLNAGRAKLQIQNV